MSALDASVGIAYKEWQLPAGAQVDRGGNSNGSEEDQESRKSREQEEVRPYPFNIEVV
jgi:hypothetical protein